MLKWSDSLAVNVRDIDSQHMELVNMVNYLYDAMAAGAADGATLEIIGKMKDYAVYHFSTEERYMEKHKYPEFADHKSKHDDFREKVIQIEKNCNSGEGGVSMDIIKFLSKWLVTHIIGVDKQLGLFLRETGVC
ncbi:MAG: hemerythrin family protein [Deltaproteobacteria bacterium]|nr:hemerythrin family protein [Deltaproteobacteria bacterium]